MPHEAAKTRSSCDFTSLGGYGGSMRISMALISLLAGACGASTTLRYVPAEMSETAPPVARSEPTESTAEELLAGGWTHSGWIYRHSTRGSEESGTNDMLAEAARNGGERVRFIQAQRTKERVTAYVVGASYATYAASGTRGHIRRIGEVWRRDPEAARAQLEERARVKPDPVIASASASCEAGEAEACFRLAEEHRALRRVGSLHESVALDRRACALGWAPACLSAARRALLDIRLAEVRAGERESVERGCGLGDATCCELRELLTAYDRDPDQDAHARATALGLAWCDRGDASACSFAGARFASTAHGKYGPTDQARADQLYQRATELTREACSNESDVASCGSMLFTYPEGPERDRARARFSERMEPICAQGMIYACFRMAWHYYNDRFSDELQPRALELFGGACDAGIGEACFLEGSMLSRGRGVPRDPSRAAARHARGCALGHPNACSSLEPR